MKPDKNDSGKRICYLLSVLAFSCWMISCSGDQNEPVSENPQDAVQFSDSIFVNGEVVPANIYCDLEMIVTPYDTIPFADYEGTICCVAGPEKASPDDTLFYSYHSNLPDSAMQYNWNVLSGSITLLSGQNTQIAKFIFGPDFTNGSIHGGGKSPLPGDSTGVFAYQCTTSLEVSKK
jgi:hypothetical protein